MVNEEDRIRKVIEDFLEELEERYSQKEVEKILRGELKLESSSLGSSPETFTEDSIIWKILDVLELERESGRPRDSERKEPDFKISNLEGISVIGENKPLNNSIEKAQSELKSEYLSRMAWPNYGLATDGFEWRIFKVQKTGDSVDFPRLDIGEGNLRQVILQIAREKHIIPSQQVTKIDVEEKIRDFVSTFKKEELRSLFVEEAPRKLREERKKDIDEFFELYIELLFGEGSKYDYDINLLNEIKAPEEAKEEDKRLFAITLMNRLLFVKFLETREILPENFLRERVEEYEKIKDYAPQNLYKLIIDPLFYELLGTEEDERDAKQHGSQNWFKEVPYLNGGLFREKLDDEREYSVSDRILPKIVEDLIEGSKLTKGESGFDPGLLGSVFEKTINHIEADKTQKDIGAFYTPTDVTELIVEQSVNPKLKEKIVEGTIEALDDGLETSIRSELEPLGLAEILRRIEAQDSFFASADPAKNIQEGIKEINVLDPACGSGHFLTTAMDQIYQVQLSLLLNLNRGEEPSDKEKFEAKRDIALNCIYGVDVDEIASEIAMLRVWLKIVEDNGWEEEFGKLPNIDINIASGNSLIGFPIKGESQATFDVANDQLEKLERLRRLYKDDQLEKEELKELEEEVREVLNEQYLKFQTNYVETEIADLSSFQELRESIEGQKVDSIITEVKVEREDSEALSDRDKNFLKRKGFSWQDWRETNKSASLDVQERRNKLGSKQNGQRDKEILDDLEEVLSQHFKFTKVIRRPVKYDLENILGRPFHWGAEFPEVLSSQDVKKGDNLEFDIVLGNPPYGDITGNEADMLLNSYKTSNINEVSMQFIERELQILDESGYFGNITSLSLVYKSNAHKCREIVRKKLSSSRIACFTTRPSQVFKDATVRVGILTGKKDKSAENKFETSRFIRFSSEDREQKFNNISYQPVEGLELGKKIGDTDSNYIFPKIGHSEARSILEKIRDNGEDLLGDRMERGEENENTVWRSYHPQYWINPCLENIYGENKSRDFKPMNFDSELERNTVFILMQSSLFYFYWMVYENQMDLNWGVIDPFPLPAWDKIEKKEDEITELAEAIWSGMKKRFDPNAGGSGEIQNINELKDLIDKTDELLGSMYGLNTEEIRYLKQFDAEYGRGKPEQTALSEDDS